MYVSQTPKFLNPSEPLKVALSSLAGYNEREAAMTRATVALASAVTTRTEAQKAKAGLAQAVMDALMTDNPKADLLAVVNTVASDGDLDHAERVVNVIDAARDQLAQERDAHLLGSTDDLLTNLDAQLQTAVTLARSVDLGGVVDAEDAITAGNPELWATFAQARSTIHRIRAAQDGILSGLVKQIDVTQHRTTFGTIKNFASLFPDWLATRRDAFAPDGTTGRYVPPWPDDANAFLLYVVQHHELELWVPTAAQVRDAYAVALKAAKYRALDPEEQKRADRHEAQFNDDLALHARAAANRADVAYADSTFKD